MSIVDIAGDADITTLSVGTGREIEFSAELGTPFIVSDDDTSFDKHLANRDIELRNQFPDLIEFGRRVVDKKRVGARVRSRSSPLGKYVLIFVGDQRLHVGRFRVGHLKALRAEGF